jgi:hypothetical protein
MKTLTPDNLASDIRDLEPQERAWRYFDGGRADFQRRHPNRVDRVPWLAIMLILIGVAGISSAVMAAR